MDSPVPPGGILELMSTRPARTVSISVGRDPGAAYAYLRDPRHLPQWAPGFARSVHLDGDQWVVETTGRAVGIAFVAENTLGVVDHRVTGDGIDDLNPMRVIANGDGCEVLLTLFQPAGTSDTQFRNDVRLVQSDLRTLKRVLENDAR